MRAAVPSRDGMARVGDPGSAVLRLAVIEARRHLTGVTLWLGVAGTVWWVQDPNSNDWQGAKYGSSSMATVPLALAAFIGMSRSVGRDHRVDLPPLDEAAPLGEAARIGARLLGGSVYLVAAVVITVAVRIQAGDGYWVGDAICYPGPCFGRTDKALPSIAEWGQNVLTVAVAATAGAAAGRAVRRKAPLCILAGIMLFLVGATFWAFQWSPAIYTTLYQYQPLELNIDPALRPADFPRHWFIAAPDEFDSVWRRVVTSERVAVGHDIYLAGLSMAWGALALQGGTGRRLLVIGVVVVAAGIIAQIAAMPAGTALGAGS